VNATDLGWAFLFLVVVGGVIAIGVVVGMIAAGRIDRLMSSTPHPRPDDRAQAGAEPSRQEDQS